MTGTVVSSITLVSNSVLCKVSVLTYRFTSDFGMKITCIYGMSVTKL